MKKSEELRQEAGSIDSDLVYLGAMNKIMREERKERFEEEWLAKLKEKTPHISYNKERGRYEILYEEGRIDFYPKANKIYFLATKKWLKPGLQWIIKNFKL